MNTKKIAVLALGGTIAMTRDGSGGVVPNLNAADLLAAVPQLQDIAAIDAYSFRQLPGAHLQYDDIEQLAQEITKLAAQAYSGVVITQGTDTIEETAFILDRLLAVPIAVVVTGAMRNPTLPGADGPANILAAVRVASDHDASQCGCVVVLNDQIHAARFVSKQHSSFTSAFGSPNCGPIGWVSEDKVHMLARIAAVAPIKGAVTGNARVALLRLSLGDDAQALPALTAQGLDGLVVEGMGGGHVPANIVQHLEQLAERMPVILCSRTGAGATLANTYGFVGSEIDLQKRGLVRAGWLDGIKSKILLTLLLRRGYTDKNTLIEAFAPWGGGVTH